MIFIQTADADGPSVVHYRRTCQYCQAVVEVIVTRITRGTPENIRKVRGWLYEGKAS
jgi:hypothetical protein